MGTPKEELTEFDHINQRLDGLEGRAGRRDEDDALSVEALGVKTRATGKLAGAILLPILLFMGLVYVLRDHEAATARQAEMVNASVKAIEGKQDKLQEGVDALVYVLTLDDKQRKDLKLDMPESLRRKTR